MARESGAPKRRYPHPQSILCYSRILHEIREDGTVTGSMPVLPDHLDSSGRMRIGALAPLVDSCAGVLAARAVQQLSAHVGTSPELANVAVGRFVDKRRALCNFEDVMVKPG